MVEPFVKFKLVKQKKNETVATTNIQAIEISRLIDFLFFTTVAIAPGNVNPNVKRKPPLVS